MRERLPLTPVANRLFWGKFKHTCIAVFEMMLFLWILCLLMSIICSSQVEQYSWSMLAEEINNGDCHDFADLFNKWIDHSSIFFDYLTSCGMENILLKTSSVPSLDRWDPKEIHDQLGTWAKELTLLDIYIADVEVCSLICLTLLPHLNPKLVITIPTGCRHGFYSLIQQYPSIGYDSQLLQSIPAIWLIYDRELLLNAINSLGSLALRLCHYELLASLLSNDILCRYISTSSLKALSLDQLQLIRPSCFAQISQIDTTDLSSIFLSLDPHILSFYSGGLSPESLRAISSSQLSHLGSKLKTSCEHINLMDIPFHLFPSLNAKCVCGYIGMGRRSLGVLWQLLNPYTLAKLQSLIVKHRRCVPSHADAPLLPFII